MISGLPQVVTYDAPNQSFLGPGAIFEVPPRAKKSKLGQKEKDTHEDISNDARNIIEVG